MTSNESRSMVVPDKLILVGEKRLRELVKKEEDYNKRLLMDTTICPDPECASDETFSAGDFLEFGYEVRECEACGKKYRIHFTTLVDKIVPLPVEKTGENS